MKIYNTIILILTVYQFANCQCIDNLLVNGTFEADLAGQRITGSGWGSFLDPDLHSIDSEIPSGQWEWNGKLENSPQGGNWQNIAGAEIISQVVKLQIGKTYTLSLEYASQPISSDIFNKTTDDASRVSVYFDDSVVFESRLDNTPYSWEHTCYLFQAESSEVTIKFKNLTNSYLAIDNICLLKDDSQIELPDSYNICLGEELEIDVSEFTGGEVLWSTGSLNNSIVLEEEGEYWVDFIGRCGTIRETFAVYSKDCGCTLYVPTMFNPSLDGLNQSFELGTSCPLKSYYLSIYDRWGNEIFLSNSVLKSWDGTFLNQIVNPGTYSYVLEYQVVDSLNYKTGIVTLIR